MKATILALRFFAMRDLKEMFSVRLVPLAKSLIKAEAAAGKCSESEVIELWAFRHAQSAGAKALLAAHAESDPLAKAVAHVIRETAQEEHGTEQTTTAVKATAVAKVSYRKRKHRPKAA